MSMRGGLLQQLRVGGGAVRALASAHASTALAATGSRTVGVASAPGLARPVLLQWPGFRASGAGVAAGAAAMGGVMGRRAMSELVPAAISDLEKELEGLPEAIKRMLSLENASQLMGRVAKRRARRRIAWGSSLPGAEPHARP
ncbi:hypothetical protein T484DRAFT_1882745 [Baffinella frigidus]|nr:hypothetical protein T484DRAFT_1882745 [Cryptophyta sp. CCMP2293]